MRRCCERFRTEGIDVVCHHRDAREGFKSGALAAGLETATGELVAIFDADFVPATDFLQRTVHHFTDEKVGVVQAEWRHLNRDESTLTQCQAMFLDAHIGAMRRLPTWVVSMTWLLKLSRISLCFNSCQLGSFHRLSNS